MEKQMKGMEPKRNFSGIVGFESYPPHTGYNNPKILVADGGDSDGGISI